MLLEVAEYLRLAAGVRTKEEGKAGVQPELISGVAEKPASWVMEVR